MAQAYKTPGVYIEEIPKFPPSIAAVETAIPAFIGYTEKAVRDGETLINKPIRIESIAEYELYFGGSPSQNVTLFLDTNNQFVRSEAFAKLYLYDSLRLFYANGGGKCYIVSVGPFPVSVSSATLESALVLLEQEDEPTLILAPDVVSDTNGPFEFQKKALVQCNKLQDRFVICDLTQSVTNTAFNASVTTFRNSIGINYLKYGAAYGPWIRANLPRTLLRRNITLLREGVNTAIQLGNLTNDEATQAIIADLLIVEGFVTEAKAVKDALSGDPAITLEDHGKELTDNYNAATLVADIKAAIKDVTDYMVDIINAIDERYDLAPTASERFKLRTEIEKYIESGQIKSAFRALADHHIHLAALADPNAMPLLTAGADLDEVAGFLGFTDSATLLGAASANVSGSYNGLTTVKQRADVAISVVLSGVSEAIAFFHFLEATQLSYEKTLNETLLAGFGLYKNLVSKAAEALNLLPPSGAIAGVYAAVDRDRGVWKAPANVSLNAVTAPAVTISHEQQGEFNVDVNGGKSVNIIRSFTGKGTLVWGARTLAGNDNEWRYVSVRRFFNFVEESVKKATEPFVFEPNDANTWVRVQAMIENFLTVLWRQGALQGIKPEHAFYVAVGLGKTMTPLDILEGRMIIEIGMAAVRPAEFIILRFSHKMPES
ncbi:MAG: phage tail sheath C-terminal domain-containing protein [Methylicorpusculum sp.]|uniref:phage tail sheath C-terminal domain-containing protein n=1 Tax=Methylicorpusculum sp. TaxID=2713644 RepID=UPI00271DE4A9|nr:phage tail sheath C-terminal domain-containing protein [Methylicorpusculum sp.]MDO8937573.1 phage tail sheath C-terminal domain-containing protein [Methylicorpusculum sp.]MDP2203090.1 phage tail sheath C-terminal domain-containing protein [Methylicorpusculum sp.]